MLPCHMSCLFVVSPLLTLGSGPIFQHYVGQWGLAAPWACICESLCDVVWEFSLVWEIFLCFEASLAWRFFLCFAAWFAHPGYVVCAMGDLGLACVLRKPVCWFCADLFVRCATLNIFHMLMLLLDPCFSRVWVF
jgi:hypothetical protein